MAPNQSDHPQSHPLADLDEWEEFLRERYPAPQEKASFRDYGDTVRPAVREFYRLNHRYQTVEFVQAKKRRVPGQDATGAMGIWEAMEFLNTLVDDSDPDTELYADRAPDADRRGDPRRRPPALVHPDRA